jgi:hypothetical protein
MMDNIISSKLYRAGSVGYVSKSGGMSNELNNILSYTTNGTYEGIAIGGDRYPGSTFIGMRILFRSAILYLTVSILHRPHAPLRERLRMQDARLAR